MSLENLVQKIPPEVTEIAEVTYEFSGLAFGLMAATGFLMEKRRLGSVIGVAGSLGLVAKTAMDIYGMTIGATDMSNLAGDAGGLMITLLSIREAMKRHGST